MMRRAFVFGAGVGALAGLEVVRRRDNLEIFRHTQSTSELLIFPWSARRDYVDLAQRHPQLLGKLPNSTIICLAIDDLVKVEEDSLPRHAELAQRIVTMRISLTKEKFPDAIALAYLDAKVVELTMSNPNLGLALLSASYPFEEAASRRTKGSITFAYSAGEGHPIISVRD